MPNVVFNHPALGKPLEISTGADEITWGYGLNTMTYPTYGGEVVQILSAYTDNLIMTGTVPTYAKLEEIYKYFLGYMQIATQTGTGEVEPFNQQPITMSYPERDWTVQIKPRSLPGFRYGRDVVAPEWRIEAEVVEADRSLTDAIADAASRGIDLQEFGRVTSEIGYTDPKFSTAFPDGTVEFDPRTKDLYAELGDYFISLFPSYSQGDFDNLLADYSEPMFGDGAGKPKEDG